MARLAAAVALLPRIISAERHKDTIGEALVRQMAKLTIRNTAPFVAEQTVSVVVRNNYSLGRVR